MIKELQLVFTIKNEGVLGEFGFTHIFEYTEALVKLLQ